MAFGKDVQFRERRGCPGSSSSAYKSAGLSSSSVGIGFCKFVVFLFLTWEGVSREERSDRVRSWFFKGIILGISFPDIIESVQAIMHVSEHVVVAVELRKPCGGFVNCQCHMCVSEDGEFLVH